MTSNEYGAARVRVNNDDTRTVDHADDVLGVDVDVLDRHAATVEYTGDVLTLDTAGDYRYRLIGPAPDNDRVLLFERIKAGRA